MIPEIKEKKEKGIVTFGLMVVQLRTDNKLRFGWRWNRDFDFCHLFQMPIPQHS